jgi:hypothetical protein
MQYKEEDTVRPITRVLLAVAAALVAAPAARAQVSFLPPNQPATFRYTDPDGVGTITLTNTGTDTATGGVQIRVTIVQNNVQYNGSGLVYPLAGVPQPNNNLITFSVQAATGQTWFYQGFVGLGVELQGSGTFHPLNNTAQVRNWGLLFVPNPGPGPGPIETLTLSIDRGCGSTYPLNSPIVIRYGASVNTTLTLVSMRADGSQSVIFTNVPVAAGQTYAVQSFVAPIPVGRTLVLTSASGVQTACGFNAQ